MEDFIQIVTLKNLTHYSLHFLFPGLVAYLVDKKNWKKTWLLFIATMLVDLDHLFAVPIFDPNRCSIGFHLLHSYYAIAAYAVLFLLIRKNYLRIIFLGLLMHMATDYFDCFL